MAAVSTTAGAEESSRLMTALLRLGSVICSRSRRWEATWSSGVSKGWWSLAAGNGWKRTVVRQLVGVQLKKAVIFTNEVCYHEAN